jgi:hypothetical protein
LVDIQGATTITSLTTAATNNEFSLQVSVLPISSNEGGEKDGPKKKKKKKKKKNNENLVIPGAAL